MPKISYLFLILIVLVIFLLIKVFSLSSEDKPVDYFPNVQMVKIFEANLDNDGFTHIVDRIKDEKIQIKQIGNNTNVAMVYDFSNEMVRLVFTSEEDEFKEDYISDIKENRDSIIIKAPLTIGTTWEDSVGGKYRIIDIESMIKTPAGEFETVVIGYNNDDFNVREYYAKEIGLVKIVINNYLVNELVDIKIDD